jgi:predicted amidophosphoribosyltransferase
VRRCVECAGRRIAFASARAAVAYDDNVRRFVAAWKEQGLRRLARIGADVVAEVVAPPDAVLITFVPPSRDRTLKRGHHPAERLAHELSERWELPVRAVLRRAGAAPRQRGSSVADRRINVRGAFHARAVTGRVALVDDVYTSGATASAAASALRKAGASRVEVVTFARALRLR